MSPSVSMTSPSTTRTNVSPPGIAGKSPLRPPGAMESMTGQRVCPIQGTECLDRDQRPGAGELRTSAGADEGHRAALWLGEKLAQADPERQGDALQRSNGWRDLAVLHPEIRLGEKPVLVAKVRIDIPKPRRSCRMRSPITQGLIGSVPSVESLNRTVSIQGYVRGTCKNRSQGVIGLKNNRLQQCLVILITTIFRV